MERGHAGSKRMYTCTQSHRHTVVYLCVRVCGEPCRLAHLQFPDQGQAVLNREALHSIGWNREILKLKLAPMCLFKKKKKKSCGCYFRYFVSHIISHTLL